MVVAFVNIMKVRWECYGRKVSSGGGSDAASRTGVLLVMKSGGCGLVDGWGGGEKKASYTIQASYGFT